MGEVPVAVPVAVLTPLMDALSRVFPGSAMGARPIEGGSKRKTE